MPKRKMTVTLISTPHLSKIMYKARSCIKTMRLQAFATGYEEEVGKRPKTGV